MKAIFINSMTSGGAENVVSKLINRNHLLLITIWPETFYLLEESIEHHTLLRKKGVIFFDLLVAIFRLYRLIKKRKIVVINSHLFWANYVNVLVSKFTKHSTICTHCVSFLSKYPPGSINNFFHSICCSLILKKADRHIYKSVHMKKEYTDKFNFMKSEVIYNPIDLEKNLLRSEKAIDFPFDEKVVYGLCVGRFHATKNQLQIIRVLQYLPETYHIIFLGNGSQQKLVIQESIKLGMTSRAHFLNNVNNPYPFYKKCHFFLSLSKSEGFPNVLAEAISLKCLPLFFDCPTGPREIISFGSNKKFLTYDSGERYPLGFLITNLEPKALASDIVSIIRSEYKISPHHRKLFLDSILINSVVNKYNSCINSMCGEDEV